MAGNPPAVTVRELIERDGFVQAPGAYDMLSALLVQRAGFSCVYLTGNGQTASTLGAPDLGLITLPEMAERVRQTSFSTGLPIIVDADTGYGGLLTLQRAVREFEAGGASAIQVEDQLLPKKCGHEPGRQVVGVPDMLARLRAAADARRDPATMLIARTDARSAHGLAEAIDRARAYAEVADVLFVESPESEQELAEIAAAVPKPVLANMVETGRTPYLPAWRLRELGYAIAIYPVAAALAASAAVLAVLEELRVAGRAEGMLDRMLTLREYHDVLRFDEAAARELHYLS
ncbi:MAG TPA: isocitrate lyase/phosphoenolpyruvate mutase family protein [Actinomycetota bacterium]